MSETRVRLRGKLVNTPKNGEVVFTSLGCSIPVTGAYMLGKDSKTYWMETPYLGRNVLQGCEDGDEIEVSGYVFRRGEHARSGETNDLLIVSSVRRGNH